MALNEELQKINRNKTRSYRTESLSLLRKELSIESYISVNQEIDKTCDKTTNLLELSSKHITKKMGLPRYSKIMEYIPNYEEFRRERKLAILCNRDDRYLEEVKNEKCTYR